MRFLVFPGHFFYFFPVHLVFSVIHVLFCLIFSEKFRRMMVSVVSSRHWLLRSVSCKPCGFLVFIFCFLLHLLCFVLLMLSMFSLPLSPFDLGPTLTILLSNFLPDFTVVWLRFWSHRVVTWWSIDLTLIFGTWCSRLSAFFCRLSFSSSFDFIFSSGVLFFLFSSFFSFFLYLSVYLSLYLLMYLFVYLFLLFCM